MSSEAPVVAAPQSRTVLVTGATGFQGGGFITAVAAHNSTAASDSITYDVIALSRNVTSPRAQKLAAIPRVKVVQCDLDDSKAIREVFTRQGVHGSIWGVFCVLAFPGLNKSAEGEEKQGMNMVDVSVEFGVQHFIYSSAERGHEKHDDEAVLDRAVKIKIERRIKALPADGMRWTILRPGFFLQNFVGTIGAVTTSVLRTGLKATTRVQVLDARDAGHVALAASAEYSSKIMIVSAENVTITELCAAYKRGAGKDIGAIPNILAKILLGINSQARVVVQDIERVDKIMHEDPAGPDGNLTAVKAAYPAMKTVETWAKEQHEQRQGYNQVTMKGLLTGKQ